MAEIEVGDVVLARGSTGRFWAQVKAVRLGRLAVERCDGRPSGPLSRRDVLRVFKDAGAPDGRLPSPGRERPSGQLRLDLGKGPAPDDDAAASG
ncbi:hypothetical protein [Conexibacter sp. SYSU D00693]|uniref:hypothetical protein n=1 Tax=Conexibacter sp. SYSU D00693 TaxID=2812560 RepID=UPI00196A520E|nr:hypothetical protein [Conexibacter sp. SYSU D00693]